MDLQLLHYRGWQGSFHRPIWAVWPIARTALKMLFRRWIFWILYAFGLLIFLMFFFGGYMLDWLRTEIASAPPIEIGGRNLPLDRLLDTLEEGIILLNGGNRTYAYFFHYQGAMLMVVLALTGSILVGNDYIHGSVPFFLAKPLSRWHYILGKWLAVGVVINMLTTLPALLLFLQNGLSDYRYFFSTSYFYNAATGGGPSGLALLLGIFGYGLLLTVVLGLILVAVASWARKTMTLVLIWTSLFLFFRIISEVLVDLGQDSDASARWRLMDLWNNLRLVGCTFLGLEPDMLIPQPQPSPLEAAVVLLVVSVLCLIYLNRKTRAVEIIT